MGREYAGSIVLVKIESRGKWKLGKIGILQGQILVLKYDLGAGRSWKQSFQQGNS
jgi:hypothetical protein